MNLEENEMHQNRKVTFMMYKYWYEQIKLLSNKQRGELLTAVYNYQCNGEDFVTDNKDLLMLWMEFKTRFDFDEQMYENKCRKNSKNAKKRWSNANA